MSARTSLLDKPLGIWTRTVGRMQTLRQAQEFQQAPMNKPHIKIRKKYVDPFWRYRWTYECECGTKGHAYYWESTLKNAMFHATWICKLSPLGDSHGGRF